MSKAPPPGPRPTSSSRPAAGPSSRARWRSGRRVPTPAERCSREQPITSASQAGELSSGDGRVRSPDGRAVSYWELVGEAGFGVTVEGPVATLPASERTWAGVGLRRVDLPAKVRGEAVFVHDTGAVRHARVVRPGWIEHALAEPVDAASLAAQVEGVLGVAVDVVVDGSFVAVVADREGDAVLAAEAIGERLRWREPLVSGGRAGRSRPDGRRGRVVGARRRRHGDRRRAGPGADPRRRPRRSIAARYAKPFLLHGSIGPSCAVARFDGHRLDIRTHSQGVELLAPAVAEALDLAGRVGLGSARGRRRLLRPQRRGRRRVRRGAGRVPPPRPGGEGAVVPGRRAPPRAGVAGDGHGAVGGAGRARPAVLVGPRRLQLRPHRPPVPDRSRALRPAGDLVACRSLAAARGHDPAVGSTAARTATPIRSTTSATAASPATSSAAARSVRRRRGASARSATSSPSSRSWTSSPTRRAWLPDEFRIAHLGDPRAIEVIEAAVDLAGGLVAPGGVDAPGRGLAFARYENVKAYVAVVAEASVDPRTGRITLSGAWIAADAGEVIDPGGLANQLEGGFVQAASWTLRRGAAHRRRSCVRDATGRTTRSCASPTCRRSRPGCCTGPRSPCSARRRRSPDPPRPRSPTPCSRRPAPGSVGSRFGLTASSPLWTSSSANGS